MKITAVSLYKSVSGNLTYLPNLLLVKDLLDQHTESLNVVFYLRLAYTLDEDPDKKIVDEVIVNLSDILKSVSQPSMFTTIQELLDSKTDIVALLMLGSRVPSYVLEMSNTKKSLTIAHVLNTNDFQIHYSSLKNLSERNIKTFRHRLTDLVIEKVNNNNPINLSNCLCMVNGMVSKPVLAGEELVMKDGAVHFASVKDNEFPNVSLLDFSDIGNIETIPFSRCTRYFKSPNESSYGDIEYVFPEGTNLSGKTVLLVCANTLFIDPVYISNSISVVINPGTLNLKKCLCKTNYATEEYLPNTNILKEIDCDLYIKNVSPREDHYGAFFILIDSPGVQVLDLDIYTYADSSYLSKGNNYQLILDVTNNSILDAVRVDYNNLTSDYTSIRKQIHISPDIDHGMVNNRLFSSHEEMQTMYSSTYKLITLVGS